MDVNDMSGLIPLSTVTRLLPPDPGGRPFHPSTARRWALYGIRGGVRLESVKLAGKRFTRVGWLEKFLAECREVDPGEARRTAGR